MLRIEFLGEFYNEECNLYYNNDILYSGYVDDLVTSINNCLAFKLNYGKNKTCITVLKKLQDKIFFIPIQNINLNIHKNIIVNISEIEMVWEKIGYDFDDDINLINEIDKRELKLLWLINSKGLNDLGLLISNKIKDMIIAIIDETLNAQEMFYFWLDNSWNNIEGEITRTGLHMKNPLVIYIEHENKINEWIPLFYERERNIVLNLGCEWGVKISLEK
ncbi:hypothetical protein [Clostridium botulinum]|uniref:Uncharacterized protein n=1 Tax=Clostridium botulinum TaxID=1491 RepID=A0A9Q1ZCF0_CLOBO|nr:hypothetical protein [Clostridium botulinum]AEB75055.1 hypothetical protein CbC4_0375 [Clostridium botulinum BKT015925]KEI03568.1 hypothetical protein Z953_03680 [Clostridium botulinum D str. 16868]KEI04200.1 hypothetical protein Y848_02460 [Clostridium botulinum C/D str. Sp77]KLU74983.1 hypothetical protein CBC3_11005 [Clostridium botulinum V891]KOA77964.1 hypothetical protein ADU78_02515 [Clostridium botulinum]